MPISASISFPTHSDEKNSGKDQEPDHHPTSHPTITQTQTQDYFDSLDQLVQYFQSNPTHCYTPPLDPNPDSIIDHQHPKTNDLCPQLIVTHDFKGGYHENQFKRGYSFEWLGAVDIFIYFSHHRVSIPPSQWITAAKTHQTKILGTLIFENQSIDDLKLLINGPTYQTKINSTASSTIGSKPIDSNFYINLKDPYDSISTYFADRLIDLAIYRQFHGWLINIELDLKKLAPDHSINITHAIKIWLEYLRRQGKRRVGPDWEVCWYDSVSFLDGRLAWQSKLHPKHNIPFFSASSSIFLDYHWNPECISATQALTDQLIHRQSAKEITSIDHSLSKLSLNWGDSFDQKALTPEGLIRSIFFGVDVYGRGCPYGGGFSSWKAASEILKAGFSVALFAPGWTWESDLLHQDRTNAHEFESQWWNRWWRDERYFWTGLLESTIPILDKDQECASQQLNYIQPPNAHRDSTRIYSESKQPLKPTRSSKFSELPQHLPCLDLFAIRSTQATKSFYTNWSLGSGHGFWIEGQLHFDDQYGIGDWSDMAMSFPINDLSVGGGKVWSIRNDSTIVETGLARCDSVDCIGWFGSGGIEIKESPRNQDLIGTIKYVWMNTTSIQCDSKMSCRLIWRPIDPKDHSFIGLVFQNSEPSSSNQNQHNKTSKVSVNRSSDSSSIGPSTVTVSLSPPSTSSLETYNLQTYKLESGWFETTCQLKSNLTPTLISRIGICVSSENIFSHHLGEMSILPSSLLTDSKFEDDHNKNLNKTNQLEHISSSSSLPTFNVKWEPDPMSASTTTKISIDNKNLSGKLSWKLSSDLIKILEDYTLQDLISYFLIFISYDDRLTDHGGHHERLIGIVRGIQELNLNLIRVIDHLQHQQKEADSKIQSKSSNLSNNLATSISSVSSSIYIILKPIGIHKNLKILLSCPSSSINL